MPDITVGEYLLRRLRELDIEHVFGVPGDYNLGFLDQVLDFPGLDWVGTCNELDAGYAADGYSRLRGAAAVVTTFGVGELSAVNAVAGSYAESVPVVAVTGMPATAVAAARTPVHHTLMDGEYDHFGRMFAEVTVARATLTTENAPAEIDRVLRALRRHRKPVHLNLPTDVVLARVPAPAAPLPAADTPTDPDLLRAFRSAAAHLLADARTVSVLAGHEADRHGLRGPLADLLDAAPVRAAVYSTGKGLVDEHTAAFAGVYTGEFSTKPARIAVEDTDCLILAGAPVTDTVTGGFSHHFPAGRTIDLRPHRATVGRAEFPGIIMADALRALTGLIREMHLPEPPGYGQPVNSSPQDETAQPTRGTATQTLTQDQLWAAVSDFLPKSSVLVAEQGTAFFGAQELPLPEDTRFIGQPMWGSIGYTLPATLGTQLAAPNRRSVLVIGDGSLQLTAQELGTLTRHSLSPVIIIINNDGYTVERAIHGATASYNDIAPWNYTALPAAFGGDDRCVTRRVTTPAELTDALSLATATPDRLVLIEAVLPRNDAPELLTALAGRFAEQNDYGA
ncbi:alpha-keto acid decarboxylase family protein [Streptomyces pinistramenti]|uniref:alpha-keto acid decarboxylase family protein n=1 Tax=Streptomyces pinistramenti TaxID=2884812 RepID=UPI001D080809|nr:alpha-keto acid decarboxylase family protein [Streptomyces pinistramenti]MCB5908800.1 alpha-keto acid decarboxylase family protein [Streptomyces pinistramenti]